MYNMYTQNKIFKNIYLNSCKTGSEVNCTKRYSVTVITLRYILHYHIMLYHSLEKLAFLSFIALGI
jgi:hypothetical protein